MTPDPEAVETPRDVTIVGGGLVGASLACALSGHGVRTALVEPFPFDSDNPPGYDDRTIALAEGSRRILDGLGVWNDIAPQATPIRRIHVSDRGRFGSATLSASEQGVAALGYVATARGIGRALTDRLAALPDVSLLMPATLDTLQASADGMHLTVSHDATLSRLGSRLLVAADGARSRVRELLDIGVRRWEYGQTAIVANVTPEHPHEGVAYERFTETGPLALLPLSEGRCALVCTVRDEEVEALMNLDDAGFADLLHRRFGARLGRMVRVGERQAHPLAFLRARVDTRPRVAVIGNAAHTLHPVAGQGFNLGLRDVAALAEVVVDAVRTGDDPGSDAVLLRYARWRRWDQARTAGFTDGLVRLFSNPLGPIGWLRSAGLVAFDLLPPAKRLLSRSAMGLTGRLPRLARGLSL